MIAPPRLQASKAALGADPGAGPLKRLSFRLFLGQTITESLGNAIVAGKPQQSIQDMQ